MFGHKQGKAAPTAAPHDTVARAEIERLSALPVADLAAALLPAFAPHAEFPVRTGTSAKFRKVREVGEWLVQDYSHGRTYSQMRRDGITNLDDLERPVLEALQALEHAGLVIEVAPATTIGMADMGMSITRLGESALADGSARRYLDGRATG